MFEKMLANAILTPVQSEIFGFLLDNFESKASDIAKRIKRPRGVVYKGLDELLLLGVVERVDQKKISRFRAEHPSKLEKILVEKTNKAKNLLLDKQKNIQKELDMFNDNLPELVSAYNLTHQKPGVRFYEGEAGLRKVLEDTLRSKMEICLFLDKEALQAEEVFRQVNSEFKVKREKLGLVKKIIRVGLRPETKEEGSEEYNKITFIRYFNRQIAPFKSSIQIYDNKISYQIISEGKIISIIIENEYIYEMNKVWFEFLWQNCE